MISFILTLRRMLKAMFQLIKDKEFQVLFAITFALLLSGTIFYSTIEEFSIIDALYFSVATLTTVGSSGLEPASDFGKAFTMLYMISGIGVMLTMVIKLSKQMISKEKN